MSLTLRTGPAVFRDRINQGRGSLARAVQHRIAGPEFRSAHEKIWDTPGPRWFTEDDAIWRIHADTSMFVGGIRALLLQSMHPVAMLGVSEHSGFRSDPWGRLHRTSHFLATTTYGTIADAERSIKIVRAIHGRVRGVTPEGTPYEADDPHLLGWIHAAEVDSFLASYRHFGKAPLTAADADAYVRQSGFISEKLGVVDAPTTVAELDALLARYRPELGMSAAARDAADMLLRDPPLTGSARAGYTVLAAGAVSLLPPWARAGLGLPSLPLTDRVVARPLTRAAMRTLRWALSGPTP